uniref:ATP-dependent Clp protease proteolytic subunit n=1 Tax=Durio zibethinus TaxID=66656 RepID=A0A343S8C6_DURZI|nr:clp protease proteolytic subunit [Durio zibethinus]AUN44901.1 clp protease proteolytic subunit [Durio zibethinus]
MPVGIPKVPFQVPGDNDASWVDIYNRIYRERLLFLGKELDIQTSNQLAGIMIYLSIESNSRDLFFFINSPGGGIVSGLSLFDTMQAVEPDVHTLAMGLTASIAAFLLVGGEITKRRAFPHARRVMIHQPISMLKDDGFKDWVMETDEVMKMQEDIIEAYVQRTGQPRWVINKDMERDNFMSAKEAKDHGIVDI